MPDNLVRPEPDVNVDGATQVPSTLYEKCIYNLHHDHKWQQETSLGKRVGLYRLQGEVGRGNFSYVKMAIHELTKERVAIKVLDKAKLTSKARRMLTREIASMETVHHPNIIRLYEVVETYSKLHLVMEFANGGELFNKLTTEGKLGEPEAKAIFIQLLSAVKHIHERNIIHRDIKAENVFLGPRGVVKLGDFGFSTQLTSGSRELLHTFCGSPPYAAPELFQDASYEGGPVDIWALGVLLFFMTTGHMPFPADSIAGLKRSILLGVITIPPHLSSPCRVLVRAILRQTPKDRLTVDQIMESEWMKDVTRSQVECEPWSMLPTVNTEQALSEIERTGLERLSAMGISAEMLREQIHQGARSPVIATYRIVIHRLQNNALLPPIGPPPRVPKSRTCVLL
uniref:non-specific serine/threonine protein kinase n=1 Tax=Cuerna arida TaxID=1464854 RepID=A0A1B6GBA1_9HEMI